LVSILQLLIKLSNKETEFVPTNSIEYPLKNLSVSSLFRCSKKSNENFFCRTFVYDEITLFCQFSRYLYCQNSICDCLSSITYWDDYLCRNKFHPNMPLNRSKVEYFYEDKSIFRKNKIYLIKCQSRNPFIENDVVRNLGHTKLKKDLECVTKCKTFFVFSVTHHIILRDTIFQRSLRWIYIIIEFRKNDDKTNCFIFSSFLKRIIFIFESA
jgi:hypothetical protein